MSDATVVAILRDRRLAEERDRALAAVCQHVNQALRELHHAHALNLRHDLGLDLPDEITLERQLVEAMKRCHALHVLDRRTNGARGT
jgi:hypothetical protein